MKLATRPTVFPTLTRLPVAPIKTNNRRKSIIHLLVRSNVSDFARWKPVYDAHLSARQKAGLKEEHLFRNADVPNDVLPVTAEDFDTTKAFTASDNLIEAMESVEVRDNPD